MKFTDNVRGLAFTLKARQAWIGRRRTFLLLLGFLCCTQRPFAQSTNPLRLVQTIPLPGVKGRIDHLAWDSEHGRLVVAALGNNTMEVLDVKAGKVVHTATGLHEPQGIAFVPKVNRLFVANGQGSGIDVLEGATYANVQAIPLGDDSDNVRYDPAAREIIVGFGSGGLAFIDAQSNEKRGEVHLAGHPESFQLESAGTRIFVNVPTARHIAVVDRKQRKVLSTWPLAGAQSNFPMTLDETHYRLIIGCRNPAKALVYSTESGKVMTSLDIVGDTDDLFYDAPRKRLYVSGGAGFLDVFQQKEVDHYVRLAHLPTAAGARTSLFVPKTGRLYLAVPHRGAQKAEIRVYAVQD